MRKFVIIISIIGLILFDLFSKIFFEYAYFGGACSIANDSLDIFSLCHTVKYIPILGEYLGLQLSYNSGVAFSIPITGLPLQLITIILIIGLVYQYIREEYTKKSRILDIGYSLILAGAISHAYERIFVGHVVDFIAVKYFAILNFADIFISIGAFLIVLSYVYYKREYR